MSQSQVHTQEQIIEELVEFLHSERRITFVLCPDGYPEAGPTLGTAVDLLFDHFLGGRNDPAERSQTLMSDASGRDVQAIRDGIESRLDRLSRIPDARFSLVFRIEGETTADFRFAGFDQPSAVSILGEDLAMLIRDVWWGNFPSTDSL